MASPHHGGNAFCVVGLQRGAEPTRVIHIGKTFDPQSVEHLPATGRRLNHTALAVKQLGGTGRVHDWSLSRAIVAALDIPVFLAGGLCADNVGAVIAQVKPFGVDLCSGVRTDDRLDGEKLGRFVAAVNAAPQ